MSESIVANHQLTQLPDQLRDFVPNRPPDFHYPSINGPSSQWDWQTLLEAKRTGEEITCGAAWLPTETEPGYAYFRLGKSYGGALISDIRSHVDELERAKGLGLKTALAVAGVQTSRVKDAAGVTHGELIHPSPQQFCDNADRAADAGITHVRFGVMDHPGQYDAVELVTMLGGEGRILIAPFSQDPNLSDYTHVLHDMLFHAVGQMGLSRGVAGRERLRGKIAYWFSKIGVLAFAKDLCNDIEMEIAIPEIESCVNNSDYKVEGFRPLFSPYSASRLIRRHLASRLAAEQEAGSVSSA